MNRLERLRASMAATEVDLVALSPGAHMQWLLGFAPHPDERPCILLIGPGKAEASAVLAGVHFFIAQSDSAAPTTGNLFPSQARGREEPDVLDAPEDVRHDELDLVLDVLGEPDD